MNIVIVNPPARMNVYGPLSPLAAIEIPVWAGIMAAYLERKGYDPRILDAEADGLSVEGCAGALEDADLAVFMVYGQQPSASTQCMPAAEAVARIAGVRTICIGTHPSALPFETLRDGPWTYVCEGEGPLTVLGLLHFIEGMGALSEVPGLWYWDGTSVCHNPRAPNLDTAEIADRGLRYFDFNDYRAHNWHCVAEGALVSTGGGLKRIEDIYSRFCESGVLSEPIIGDAEGVAVAAWYRGEKECVRVTAHNGLWVDVTPDHLMRVARGGELVWVAAGELMEDDWCAFLSTDKLNGDAVDPETAWILGFFIGDGFFSTNNRVGFAVTIADHEKRVLDYLGSRFKVYPKPGKPSGKNGKVRDIVTHNASVYHCFKRLVGDEKLRVPDAIFTASKESKLSFISGLMMADGYTQPGGGEYLTTISRTLADGVANLLLSVGCRPSIRGPYKRHSNFAAQPIYRVWRSSRDAMPSKRGRAETPSLEKPSTERTANTPC